MKKYCRKSGQIYLILIVILPGIHISAATGKEAGICDHKRYGALRAGVGDWDSGRNGICHLDRWSLLRELFIWELLLAVLPECGKVVEELYEFQRETENRICRSAFRKRIEHYAEKNWKK